MKTRKEKDSMGEMEVPEDALYGASTQRAVLNFPVSNLRFSSAFVSAVGLIKLAAVRANMQLGLIDKGKGEAIAKACGEVVDNQHDKHFVVDIFQTGSGTSTNMNANEVIANRAIAHLGGKFGDRTLVHPNDHVNLCQSSNDVIPTAIHVAAALSVEHVLVPGLQRLEKALKAKAEEFKSVLKPGRTHLQDATPITLGQEFGGYAAQVNYALKRIEASMPRMLELPLGGTAVGTGLNTHPEFAKKAISELSTLTKLKFVEAANHFEAQASKDACVELSGQLRVIAVSLMKIANDIRWLSSGPRANIFEIQLPEIQPGSSIMPAKVNPVICESVMMAAAHVMGNDTAVMVAGQHGNFELNVMMPVLAYNLLEAIELVGKTADNFAKQCIEGIEANVERCKELAELSLATCTSLAPKIGYDKAAAVAKAAYKEGKTVRQAALDLKVLSEDELAKVLDLESMTRPGI